MKRQTNENKYYALAGIILVTIGALSAMGMLSLSSGEVGNFFGGLLKKGFGISGIIISFYIGFMGFAMIIKRERPKFTLYMIGATLIFLDLLAVLHLRLDFISEKLKWQAGLNGEGGGVLGAVLTIGLERYFGVVGTYIILAAVLFTGLLFFDLSYRKFFDYCSDFAVDFFRALKEFVSGLIVKLLDKFPQKPVNLPEAKEQQAAARPAKKERTQELADNIVYHVTPTVEEVKKEIPISKEKEKLKDEKEREKIIIKTKNTPPPTAQAKQFVHPKDGEFQLPPLDFLRSKGASAKDASADIKLAENAKKLEETLDSFGIKAQVVETFRGPMATRYELQLMPGTKVSKIVGLSDDLALGLAASEVRIEAPIPGKAAVGIEVPNKETAIVYLKDTLETVEFQKMESKITFGLGMDITGLPVVADLAKMPHLLVAGATGMGKSVFINSLITSILFKATPTEVKFIMVDPKMVELAVYNGIPHLLAPVVTEAKKAAAVLRWIVQEMENRYHLFASAGVRNMQGYNELQLKQNTPGEDPKLLPHIVVIIDELADLMMVAAKDVEDAICRLAQMARAAGIHLVIATQRPSVDVITGVIKANIPSRIAFAVSSQIDSRTILDMGGAEKLLGKGDMLFFPVGAPKPVRVQGAFISDQEVESLVNILKDMAKPDYQSLEVVKGQMTLDDATEDNDLFEKAVQLVVASKQASASFLQRRLRIGYNRAADLIEQMEDKGIVGPATGNSKPREVLVDSLEQLEGTM